MVIKTAKALTMYIEAKHTTHVRLTFLYILGLVSKGAFIVTVLAVGTFLAAEDIVSFLIVWLLAFIGSKIEGMGDLTFSPAFATFLLDFCYST